MRDAFSPNYIRMSTSTEEEYFIPDSIDNTTPHRVPTLPSPFNTMTCNHCTIPPLTLDRSEYQSSGCDFSHTDWQCKVGRIHGKAADHHQTCHYQDDDDWKQFISYPEDTAVPEITPPTEQPGTASATLTPIDSAIVEWYTRLAVQQIGVDGYREDVGSMCEYYKQHRRDHWTNCNTEYCKTHYSSHFNGNRYQNPNFTTCSVCGTWGHHRMTRDLAVVMWEKEIKELTLECNDIKAPAIGLPPYYQASELATGWNAIATNTPCNEPVSPGEEFPLETAAVETRAIRKGTSNRAEPASTLHQHAAHIKQKRGTSADT